MLGWDRGGGGGAIDKEGSEAGAEGWDNDDDGSEGRDDGSDGTENGIGGAEEAIGGVSADCTGSWRTETSLELDFNGLGGSGICVSSLSKLE